MYGTNIILFYFFVLVREKENVHAFEHLSICQSISPFVHPSVHLFVHPLQYIDEAHK